uniref:hypothetical protein n=1 Tax=Acetatifactor sp. TaxID=1872090 RepID=UPI004057ADE7
KRPSVSSTYPRTNRVLSKLDANETSSSTHYAVKITYFFKTVNDNSFKGYLKFGVGNFAETLQLVPQTLLNLVWFSIEKAVFFTPCYFKILCGIKMQHD